MLNGKDPLLNGPELQKQLLDALVAQCGGKPNDVVLGAALNLLVNVLRQTYPLQRQVEARYDDLVGRTKTVLLSHYDGVTGKRRSVFPFTQVIEMGHHIDKDRKH